MPNSPTQNENIIQGNCADFVCCCCRTKYGWTHQIWCDYAELTEPECRDCAYYDARKERCHHPAKKMKRRGTG